MSVEIKTVEQLVAYLRKERVRFEGSVIRSSDLDVRSAYHTTSCPLIAACIKHTPSSSATARNWTAGSSAQKWLGMPLTVAVLIVAAADLAPIGPLEQEEYQRYRAELEKLLLPFEAEAAE